MSDKTSIEWTATVNPDGSVTPGATWNPTRGCSRISEGCRHCYAESIAFRFSGPGKPFEGFAKVTAPRDPLDATGGRRNGWTGRVELIEDKLTEPLSWRKPRKVFVNSMSDLFHEALPDSAIDKVFAVMALAPQHTFQVLTKRADRMRDYISSRCSPNVAVQIQAILKNADRDIATPKLVWPLPNLWLGVSVENQHFADERIPLLLQTPAAVRFISAEPLLGPVDIWKTCSRSCPQCRGAQEVQHSEEGGIWGPCPCERVAGLHWVIVGGESGHGARPFNAEWARAIVKHCASAGVPVFVKQLGANSYDGLSVVDSHRRKLHLKKKGGDPLDWPAELRVREFPKGIA